MTNNSIRTSSAATPANGLTKSILTYFGQVASTRKQRKALEKLDKTALFDLGLTQAEVDAELRRSAWDVPSNWRI